MKKTILEKTNPNHEQSEKDSSEKDASGKVIFRKGPIQKKRKLFKKHRSANDDSGKREPERKTHI